MLTLYTSAKSRGLRPLWTMEEMGLACELVVLPFPPRARAKGFLEINPLGTVPVLVDGEIKLTESCAIAEYLATRYGPSDLAVRVEEPDYGVFLDFLHHADATLTFPQTVFIRFNFMEKELGLQAAGDAYVDWFAARLAKVERRLEGRDYLCAGRFTVADIAIGYALYLATLTGLQHHLSPALKAYLERLMARPGFARARAREDGEAIAPV